MQRNSRNYPNASRLSVAAAALASVLVARESHAQIGAHSFALRGEVGAGLMVVDVQRAQLGYDSVAIQATGRLAFNPVDFLSIQLSVHNGFYLSSMANRELGRTLAFQGGLRLEPMIGRVGRLWLDGNAGLVLTGAEQRFGFDAGLGFEFQALRWLGVGPFARFHFVKHEPTENLPADAMALTFGVSFTLRPPRPDNAPVVDAPADRDGDGVLDGEDLCVEVPAGDHPDPARRGCPRPDRDGDGVYDDEDTCVEVPAGAHPDASRRGCPLTDSDGDGVFDPEDQCVTTPHGDHPDPERRGCPDGDADGDGVLDHADQCRTVPQGFNPDPAREGCPLPDRDRDSVPDVTDHCPDQPGAPSTNPLRNGCPSIVSMDSAAIHITRPVFFATNRDVILPRSIPVLTAVAEVLRAVPRIRRVSVEGHTDDVGDDASNMDLSNRRAQSVMRWLSEHGVEAARLEAHGFGETRPLRAIEGMRGRALRTARGENRRVDFNIVDPAPRRETPAAATP
ncbi:MAG: OmpA family protein [Deltaproteobacteria bacterium]|nr:OmpA family protein [Deltaproteobacteria bacterium]